MRVCVLGAGVVGLTTAWTLADAGCQVTVIDRQAGPGLEASRGNGAQLSYAFVTPLASPETLRALPAMLLDRAGPLRVRLTADPAFWRWGLAFLQACRAETARATVAAQLQLAALSRGELERISAASGVAFGLRQAGKLVVYRTAAGLAAAGRAAAASGVERQSVLSARDCLSLEPALCIAARDLAGGVYTPSEMVGDCGAFCDRLGEALRRRNAVTWIMGATATPIVRDGRLRAVALNDAGLNHAQLNRAPIHGAEVEADAFVCALGSGTVGFARAAGIRLPITPMKGYSLTLRAAHDAAPLAHSVTDADRKVVFAPLARGRETLIRAAGIADLVGYDTRIDPTRLAALRRATAAALDIDWQHGDDEAWTGLRPATPDSKPIIGWSRLPGLFLNAGHGGLGWTLAAGAARLTADLLLGRAPPFDPAPFAPARVGG